MPKPKPKPERTTLSHSNVYWRSVRAVFVRLIDDAGVHGSEGVTTIEMTVEQRDLITREARV